MDRHRSCPSFGTASLELTNRPALSMPTVARIIASSQHDLAHNSPRHRMVHDDPGTAARQAIRLVGARVLPGPLGLSVTVVFMPSVAMVPIGRSMAMSVTGNSE